MKQMGRGGASPAPPSQPDVEHADSALRHSVGEVTRDSSPADVDEPEVASRKAHAERLYAAS